METEFLGRGRIYQGGRSTEGWKRGPRVESLSQMPDGTLVWSVSHSFKSENLAIVTEQRPRLPGVWMRWANTDGTPTEERDVFAIHEFILRPTHWGGQEYFLAVRDGAEHPDNDTYRTLAEGIVLHNDNRRAYAAEMLEDEEDDEILRLEFAANSKVILDDEGKGAYVTCCLWVPNPNYVEDEDENDA